MVEIGAGPKIVFRRVEKIQILDIHYQEHESFGFLGIGNVGNRVLSKSLQVSTLLNLSNTTQ